MAIESSRSSNRGPQGGREANPKIRRPRAGQRDVRTEPPPALVDREAEAPNDDDESSAFPLIKDEGRAAIPDASVVYDADSRAAAAAAARRRVLEMVSADRIPVAGVHLDFPGYGIVTAERNGCYAYFGELWNPVI